MVRVFAFEYNDEGDSYINMNADEMPKFMDSCAKAGAKVASVLLLDLLLIACKQGGATIAIQTLKETSPRWFDERDAKSLETSLKHLEKIGFLRRDGDAVVLDAEAIHASRIVALPNGADA